MTVVLDEISRRAAANMTRENIETAVARDMAALSKIPPARLPAAEVVDPPSPHVSPDDFGALSAFPLVIAFDLVVGAVVTAAWIALK